MGRMAFIFAVLSLCAAPAAAQTYQVDNFDFPNAVQIQSPKVERGTVGEQTRARRALNDDIHRDRIGDVAPLELVLAKDDVQARNAFDYQIRPAFGWLLNGAHLNLRIRSVRGN